MTSIWPLPAEKVSTVKFAGAPTTGPDGSIPGPYARTLLKHYTEYVYTVMKCKKNWGGDNVVTLRS